MLAIHHVTESPNQSPRGSHPIAMLVLHATVGSYASALTWLRNPRSKVSTHYLIAKSGYTVQIVPDHAVAWHAGRSAWKGETEINEISLGIELENSNDGKDPYPPAQVDALLKLAQSKVAQYKIAPEMVVRHLDIALPKGRKTDPAGFPWSEFRALLFTPFAPMSYRVRLQATAGATVRAGPRRSAAVLAYLRPGDAWHGVLVEGERVELAPFAPGNSWVQADDGRCVWLGLLEVAK